VSVVLIFGAVLQHQDLSCHVDVQLRGDPLSPRCLDEIHTNHSTRFHTPEYTKAKLYGLGDLGVDSRSSRNWIRRLTWSSCTRICRTSILLQLSGVIENGVCVVSVKGTPAASPHLWRLVVLLALRGFFETYELFMTAFVSQGLVCNGVFHVGETMAMQDNAKAIFLIRLLGSIAIGTQLITLDVYASEIVPRNIRSRSRIRPPRVRHSRCAPYLCPRDQTTHALSLLTKLNNNTELSYRGKSHGRAD
jgi:hypothetical protein